jgi:hypothetical protein
VRALGRGLVGRSEDALEQAVDDLVVADRAERRGVDVHRDRAGVVVHPVDARTGHGKRVAGAETVHPPRSADRQALVGDAAADHVDADRRAVVVVVAGVTRLAHDVQPGDGVLVLPEHVRGTSLVREQPRSADQVRGSPGSFGTFVRLERPAGRGQRRQLAGREAFRH